MCEGRNDQRFPPGIKKVAQRLFHLPWLVKNTPEAF